MISMREACASRAFSTSSLTTLAGRSITSPAAIRLTVVSESRLIGISTPSLAAGRPALRPLTFQPFRLADDGDDKRIGIDQPPCYALYILKRHRFNEAVALIHIVDAEVLLLYAQELVGDLGAGVETQGVGTGQIGLVILEFVGCRAFGGKTLQ